VRPLLVAAAVVLAAPPVSAYETMTWPASRWDRGRIPVPWYLHQRGSDDVGIDVTEREVIASFDNWQNVDCCYIAFDYRGRTSMTAGSSSGSNVVSWSESGWGWDSYAIAVTQAWFGSGTIEEADIDCNGAYMNWNTTGSGGMDIQSILTHEIGHFLGLGDLYDAGHSSSTMYGVYGGGTGPRSLADDDIEGCRYLYEEPCGTPGCTSDGDCPAGYRCDAGTCVRTSTGGGMCDPCSSQEDCTGGYCLTGFPDGGLYCGTDCTSDADCGAGNTCVSVGTGYTWQCIPADGDCSGVSAGCTTDGDCPSGYRCDGGSCVPDEAPPECYYDSDCPSGYHCEDGSCVADTPPPSDCTTDGDCPFGYRCDGGSCVPTGAECTRDEECHAGYHCDDGSCVSDDPAPPECTVDSECPEGQVCRSGLCVRPPGTEGRAFGEPCADTAQCLSALCLDGYCTMTCPPANPLGVGEARAPCPAGYYCDDVGCGEGECRRGSPGAGATGAPCASDGDCATAHCALIGGAGVCLAPCDPGVLGACAATETCTPGPTAACGACLCGAGLFGDRCAGDADCAFGRCLAPADGAPAQCTTECASGRCPVGAACRTVADPAGGPPLQICVAEGLPLGSACTAHGDCQSGRCVTYYDRRYCARGCGGACGCPSGLTCTALGAGTTLCLPSGAPTDPAGLEGGCGCRAGGGAWGAGLGLLLGAALAAGLAASRRRSRRRRR
jgi:Cys-rich repeat protein